MDRSFYLDLAAKGHCAPIGTHLVLHTKPDAEKIPFHGKALGQAIAETAERFDTPIAVPLMDLMLEKAAMLGQLGIPEAQRDAYHFDAPPADPGALKLTPRMIATCEAINYVASQPGLLPCGMGIGPFSFMTKLVSDPITPIFLAGSGMTAEEEPEVKIVECCLEVGLGIILTYLEAQCDAGAKAIFVCEPAANLVYFSPNQLDQNYEIFDKFVMTPMRKIRALLERKGVDLIFHDCGELLPSMIERFATLDPAIMSFGASRKLWEDAPLVPDTTVLYGNLPTKRFYAPQLTVSEVESLTREIVGNMMATKHPFILGSECDVLSVPGSENEIVSKVDAFLALGRAMRK